MQNLKQQEIERMKSGKVITEVIYILLAIVFAYTSISKFYDWKGTLNAFGNQVFPYGISMVLARVIPTMEIILAWLLLAPRYRKLALALSVGLLTCFTLYVGIVMTGVFGRIPCSCGGMVSSLGWGEHLVLNLSLLGMSVVGWISEKGRF